MVSWDGIPKTWETSNSRFDPVVLGFLRFIFIFEFRVMPVKAKSALQFRRNWAWPDILDTNLREKQRQGFFLRLVSEKTLFASALHQYLLSLRHVKWIPEFDRIESCCRCYHCCPAWLKNIISQHICQLQLQLIFMVGLIQRRPRFSSRSSRDSFFVIYAQQDQLIFPAR